MVLPMFATAQEIEFVTFGKIHRLFRPVIITEKIDGTNAAVGVTDDGVVYAQSRKRLITPENDNAGFARWVRLNADELRDGLGPGLHFGEWWGLGIQRGYELKEKRFSLFNVSRWGDDAVRPACCSVVPTLAELPELDTAAVRAVVDDLRRTGSVAAPGYMNPEGVVTFHAQGNVLFKTTLVDDHKGAQFGA